jgi:xylan 1,4-beta-xylosidase
MLERLGRDELPVETSGDGSGSLVEAWASWDPGGRVAIATWNGTLDQSKAAGLAELGRSITLVVEGLAVGPYRLRHHRIDAGHSNIAAAWERIGSPAWPDAAGWIALRAADHLDDLEPSDRVIAVDGRITLTFDLPMPAISLVEMVPILDGS